jgi:hypothetical protein
MTGMTLYSGNAVLSWATGKLTMPAITNAQVALFLTVGNDDGTGFVEVSGNAYARAQTTPQAWGAPTGTQPVQIVNASSIQFPVSASNWGMVTGFGLYDLNNNLIFFDYLGNFPWLPFTMPVGTNAIISVPKHGYAVGDQVVLTGEYGGMPPQATVSLAGLQTIANVTVDTFTIGANVTVSGNGMLRKVLPITINLNQTAAFNPAALVLQLA